MTPAPLLELDAVRISYDDASRATPDGVSLDIRPGEVVLVLGPIGLRQVDARARARRPRAARRPRRLEGRCASRALDTRDRTRGRAQRARRDGLPGPRRAGGHRHAARRGGASVPRTGSCRRPRCSSAPSARSSSSASGTAAPRTPTCCRAAAGSGSRSPARWRSASPRAGARRADRQPRPRRHRRGLRGAPRARERARPRHRARRAQPRRRGRPRRPGDRARRRRATRHRRPVRDVLQRPRRRAARHSASGCPVSTLAAHAAARGRACRSIRCRSRPPNSRRRSRRSTPFRPPLPSGMPRRRDCDLRMPRRPRHPAAITVRDCSVRRGGRRGPVVVDGVDLDVGVGRLPRDRRHQRRGQDHAAAGDRRRHPAAAPAPSTCSASTRRAPTPAIAPAASASCSRTPSTSSSRTRWPTSSSSGCDCRASPRPSATPRSSGCCDRFDLVEHRDRHPFLLSGGQKRRLSVGTALVAGAPVLALDEPTFGQDRARAAELLDMLRALNDEGTTVLVVTHDLQLVADYADRVAVMQGGRVLGSGATAEVLAGPLIEAAGLRHPPLARATREPRAPPRVAVGHADVAAADRGAGRRMSATTATTPVVPQPVRRAGAGAARAIPARAEPAREARRTAARHGRAALHARDRDPARVHRARSRAAAGRRAALRPGRWRCCSSACPSGCSCSA